MMDTAEWKYKCVAQSGMHMKQLVTMDALAAINIAEFPVAVSAVK